jgi:hypothetical protein
VFREYNQTFQIPSLRIIQPVKMTTGGQGGQAGPGRVSRKELEIVDCELSKAKSNNFGFGFDLGIPV